MKNKGIDLFTVKLIAVALMLADHCAVVFGGMPAVRIAGRAAFPLFAFMLVNGWQKTKNRLRYFDNMVLFALISQLPFTAAVYAADGSTFVGLSLNTVLWLIIPMTLLAVFYIILADKNAVRTAILAASLFATVIFVRYSGFLFTSPRHLNIFYSLASGMVCMECANRLQNRDKHSLLYLAAAIITVVFVTTRSDYGLAGLLLILGLFFLKNNRASQCVYIPLWSFGVYGVLRANLPMAAGAAASAAVVLAYNGERGRNIKYFFYWFYPVHLFILGAVNMAVYFFLDK